MISENNGSSENRKVAIIGLDSVPPEMMFSKLLDKLPNIKKMYERGLHGNLETCHPPITVPAWMVMLTGKNPGKLGIYGFRHRRGHAYKDGYIVNSTTVKEETVWEILSKKKGKKSIILGIPPSYPPKPVENCNIVSCFITPGMDKAFTYPQSLKEEVLKAAGGKYVFDVTFRTDDRDRIKQELFEMTEKRFDVAEYLLKTKPWDFFIMHEIGFDRLHHAFWKFFDSSHPKYTPGSPYEKLDEEYYKMVDERIGRLMELLGDSLVFILSDHGSKGMHGAFCVNQWLEREGYLKFKLPPDKIVDFDKAEIDWENTKAWGWGGYYARIFFNVKGREMNGVIPSDELEKEKDKLAGRITSIKDENGNQMNNMILKPEEIYGVATGDKPDLMVYFDELNWRSAGTVGHDSLYLSENDTGPDDSVHSMNGIFLMYDPKNEHEREIRGAKIEDIAPTLLKLYGIDMMDDSMDGKLLEEVLSASS